VLFFSIFRIRVGGLGIVDGTEWERGYDDGEIAVDAVDCCE
jgi:hypothetical protein